MGRLTILLEQAGKEKLSTPVYLTDDNVAELDKFLTENQNSLQSSYINILSSYLTQVNGYFNQLMIRGEGIISQDEQNKYRENAKTLEEKMQTKTVENLEEIVKEYFSLYNDANNSITNEIKLNTEKKEKAQIISSVNDLLSKIDQAYLENDSNIDNNLLPIVQLYQKAIRETGKEQLATLTLLLDEEKRILSKDKENRAIDIATAKEKKFNLFDKINDLIVDK